MSRKAPREVVESPFPRFAVSLARALRVAGSPGVLAVAFLGLLTVWAAYALLDLPLSPRLLVNVMSLPPVQVYFDVALVTSIPLGTVPALGLFGAILAGRALLLGALASMIVRGLGLGNERGSLMSAARAAWVIFLVLALEAAAVLAIPIIARSLGPGVEVLAFMAVLVGGLHYLGFAPAVAASEQEPAAAILRRSVRAARLPGGRHLLLVGGYVSFILWTSVISPASDVVPATPGVLAWALALLATYLHLAVLGALAHRWIAVRDRVTGEPAPRRR